MLWLLKSLITGTEQVQPLFAPKLQSIFPFIVDGLTDSVAAGVLSCTQLARIGYDIERLIDLARVNRSSPCGYAQPYCSACIHHPGQTALPRC